uniref:ITPR-interacting domain-containing protein n=1 Tax=Timema tahoe TaxID=61484 RepID=A0A7R9IL59_9NEOP|nr:unnamed protein product [Timema tahoe]
MSWSEGSSTANFAVRRGEEERDDPVLDEADEHLDLGLGAEAGLLFGGWPEVIVDSPQHAEKALRTVEKGERREGLVREASVQSDVTSHTDSHCSSMESYLESRRANPEEVLLGLGFGGPRRNVDSDVSRIPQRFLNPSKVKGVAIDDFLRHQQDLAETFESGFSGYRGLIGGGSSNTLKLERSNSRAMSPWQSFSPLSPLFVENLANIPARFLPQLHHTSPRRLLNIPGKESPIKRTHSTYSRSGPSHTPSVIVSKIMEKLRTQREYSSQGSVVSQAPSTTATPSLPPQPTTETGNINNKFSHIARKVMKRTNVTSALSVLSPANREFLDSQGSKSPEVPRKRMIIGPRSFTFDCDGDLIEVESSSSSPPSTAGLPQTKPITNVRKPLIHKDSVLSTVTSMSLTSIDSDSDTDDRSSGYSPTRRPLPEISSNSEHPTRTALPLVSNVSKPVNSSFFHLPLNKRASSTSISSWESEAVSPLLPLSSEKSPSKYLNKAKSWDEDKFKEQKSQPNFYVGPDNSAFHPLRYESIDETVEMRADSMEMSPKENVLPDTEASNFPIFNSPSVEGQSEGKPSVVSGIEFGTEAKEYVPRGLVIDVHEVLSDLNTLPVSFETDTPSTVMSDPFSPCSPVPPTCLMQDQVCVLHRNTQFRRGSLMRQKNIMEEEPTDLVTVNSAKQQNNNDDVSVEDNCHHIHDSESDTTEAKNNSNGELINRDIDSLPVDKSYHLQVFNDPRGDSFEMEEIYTLEEERAPSQLLRTRSDSSGFLDGDAPDLFQEMAALHNTEQDFDSLVDPDTHIVPVSLAQDAIGTNSVLERGFITDKEDESTLSLSLGNNITKENLAHFDVINGLENGYINGLPVQRNDLECKITSASQNKVLRNDLVCLDGKINKTIKKNFKRANVRVKSSEQEQIVWPSVEAWGQDRYAKRLSLPVVCIHDETGNLHRRKSISLHSVNSDDSCADSSPKIRKVRSAPHSLAHSVFDGSSNMQTCNSYSNMFSFCSDESVIHIEPRRTSNFSNKLSLSSSSQTTIEFCGGSVNYAMRQSSSLNNLLHSSHYMESHSLNHAKNNGRRASALKPKLMNRSTKEIQELMKELTERGLEVGDSHIACNSDTQWAQLQTSTLRLAVEAYGRQLGSSTEVHTEEALECTEAQTEMLVMTALLREQTRLCQQLAGLNQETLPVQPTPHNCSQEQIVGVIREENRHLEELVESNSRELAEIRQMLKQILNTRDA